MYGECSNDSEVLAPRSWRVELHHLSVVPKNRLTMIASDIHAHDFVTVIHAHCFIDIHTI
jgi:hypothetical protein